MRAALSAMAPDAVADFDTTPAVMIARSGTRVTLPVALKSSRVPALGRLSGALSWATAGRGGKVAQPINNISIDLVILGSLT
jgi:hypothetical protein